MKKRKKIWWIILGVVIVIISLVVWQGRKKNQPQYTTVAAEIGSLKQTVSLTGTVKPVKELALNFLSAGRINNLPVKIGDQVSAGQLLAELDYGSLLLRKSEAEAGLQIAQANLNKLLSGASQQAIAVNRSSVEQAISSQRMAQIELDKVKKTAAENIKQAEKSVNDLYSSAADTPTVQEQAVITAQTNLDNAQRTGQQNINNSRSSGLIIFGDKIAAAKIALDNINTILTDNNAKYVLSVKDSSYLQRTKEARNLALDNYAAVSQAVSAAKNASDTQSFIVAANKAKQFLNQTALAINYSYSMLEATITSNNFTQGQLDNYKGIVSNQSSQINGAITAAETAAQNYHNAQSNSETTVASAQDSLEQARVALENAKLAAANNLSTVRLASDRQISTAQSQLDNANKAVDVAKAQLASITAPARSADIALAQGQISQAQANLASAQKQIDDSRLFSPLDGVVTQVNYEVGEQFSAAGKALIMVLVNNSFDIEVDVTEADINKIKVGNLVEITLDAFGDDTIFHGQVYFIEPAQTVIQDVVYYKVKISFSDSQEVKSLTEARQISIKAGMTANTTITTDQRENIVKIPGRAIVEKDNGVKVVRILKDNKLQEIPAAIGLRGDEGLVEVLGGVQPGDQVVTFIKYPKTAADKQ
ncbi:MAG TPA: efflux RND transporter periplasmic adaptor subunit [bacterium]|jgi:multidrug efflux pump subunit AcrA (membrane-fusion protein)|nr:efflux RND transporter periplasmic adaptor subunit [bacterium]HNZ51103.1 efflux RND transporter periplasmic adaptor subunit [bacterium]HOF79841.1 efflux RND transporter periplasmic adaptor subunit [bacterium]HOH85349.1 efflux RND transporter periplasmic adaptor subunit [bacterium]HOQ91642.1 efflux RND transporter periplasmic adaptor subunit [bacterium]